MGDIEALGEVLALSRDELLMRMADVPLWCCKLLGSQYPDARVRRAALRRLGVVFADDSSFVNAGFSLTPNTPSDVHVRIGRNVSVGPNVTCVCSSCANNGVEINSYPYVAERLTKRADVTICDEAWIGGGRLCCRVSLLVTVPSSVQAACLRMMLMITEYISVYQAERSVISVNAKMDS